MHLAAHGRALSIVDAPRNAGRLGVRAYCKKEKCSTNRAETTGT
jgi:hypothetical protein